MKRSRPQCADDNDDDDEQSSVSRVEESSVSTALSVVDEDTDTRSVGESRAERPLWLMRDLLSETHVRTCFISGMWPQNTVFHPFYCKTWNGRCRSRGRTPQIQMRVPTRSRLRRLYRRGIIYMHPARLAYFWVTGKEPPDDLTSGRHTTQCNNCLCINPYHRKYDPVPVPPETRSDDAHFAPVLTFIPRDAPAYTPPQEEDVDVDVG